MEWSEKIVQEILQDNNARNLIQKLIIDIVKPKVSLNAVLTVGYCFGGRLCK